MTSMSSTYTQAEAEREARTALAAQTDIDWAAEAISDAVDIYLVALEREQGRRLDRAAIPQAIVTTVIDTIIRDTRTDS